MRRRRPLWRVIRGAGQIRAEVDEEIRFHVEMRVRELEESGWGAAEARREAWRRFGDVEETRLECAAADRRREKRMERREVLSEARRDVVVALRQLRRRPGFALVAAATLAVGIGANTAIFSAADHVLLRPLPYRDADRVVTLWETDRESGERKREVSPGNWAEWRDRSAGFEALALAEPFGFDLTDRQPPEPVQAWLVTDGWFEALGVEPILGRRFLPEEYEGGIASQRGPTRVVMISHRLWQGRYGGDPGIVGRSIELDRSPATVVGVFPPGLDFPPPGRDIWAPKIFIVGERYSELTERTAAYMLAVGRLREGMGLEQAHRDMERVASAMAQEFPETNDGVGVNVVPLREHIVGDVRPALLVLLGAVAFVLLIACANVASLLLARGAERERELAVRSALGAGRGRLVRQLGTEALVLAGAGGALGLGLALAGIRAFKALAPADLPRLTELGVDGRTLLFAAGVTLATALLFGLAPALRFSRPELASALKTGGRAGSADRRQHRLRRTLVAAEVALALVLLVGAGLLGRSFVTLQENDLGFEVENRATLQLFLWDLYPTAAQRERVVTELTQRIAALPGVRDVAVVTSLPFHPTRINAQDQLIREDRPPTGQRPTVYTTISSPGYFRLMGIPLLAGRDFGETDRFDAPPVAVISESLARRFFPDEDPVGKRVTIGVMSRPISREIVGVVGDVRPNALDAEPAPELFIPFAQSGNGSLTFVARTDADAAALLPSLRETVWQVNPDQAIYHADALERFVSATLVGRRFNLALVGALSLVALVLAAIGIYGLLSFATALRTGEIGVRMALGARRVDVLGMVLREGIAMVLPGVFLGLAGAFLLTRFLAAMLYGVEPTDPVTFGAVALAMLGVAVAATVIPARRAAAADPALALRQE